MNEDDVIVDLARSGELSGALARGEVEVSVAEPAAEVEKRGRGRPTKPPVPPPPWPVITGELEMSPWAFKRGEISEATIGRLPARPPTFVYARK